MYISVWREDAPPRRRTIRPLIRATLQGMLDTRENATAHRDMIDNELNVVLALAGESTVPTTESPQNPLMSSSSIPTAEGNSQTVHYDLANLKKMRTWTNIHGNPFLQMWFMLRL